VPLNPPGPKAAPAVRPFACVLTDLDGDGVQDIIIEAGPPEEDGEVHAYSGRDGKPLWQWRPQPRQDSDRRPPSRPTLALGDLDGQPTVVVLHKIAGAKVSDQAEIVALDGRTGGVRWTWREPVSHDYNSATNGAVRGRVVPQNVRLDNQRRAVCVW